MPSEPNPGCVVCGTSLLHVELDTRATTLAQFLDRVVRRRLALACPTLEYPDFMYEEGEGLEADEVRAGAGGWLRVCHNIRWRVLSACRRAGRPAGTCVGEDGQARACLNCLLRACRC